MDVNAVAYYKYETGMYSKSEGNLNIIVEFKIDGKLFRKKLERIIASTILIGLEYSPKLNNPYSTQEEFYNFVEQTVDDKEFLRKEAKDMIERWYSELNKDGQNKGKRHAIANKIKNQDKIDINVKINE